MLNSGDSMLLIMKNGYTSAIGAQHMLSEPPPEPRRVAEGASAGPSERTIGAFILVVGDVVPT